MIVVRRSTLLMNYSSVFDVNGFSSGSIYFPKWSLGNGQMSDEKMNYAIIGGIPVFTHGYERTTNNCDILLARSVNGFD